MKKIALTILVLCSVGVYSQQEFGLAAVKELCSDEYHGRGYVNKGHIKAAGYIAEMFEKDGLSKFGDSYLQYFDIAVNTFPDSVTVIAGQNKLIPGIDYLINPASGSAKGVFETKIINKQNIDSIINNLSKIEKSSNLSFIIDNRGVSDKDSLQLFRELTYVLVETFPVFIINDSKFTWSVGREELNYPLIEVKSNLLPESVKTITLNVRNEFKEKLKTQNVIGFVEGKKKSEFIVVSAHYDHLGQMGSETYFPGANDNASGVAMLLYLAKYFKENKPKYSIAFMAFGAEEAGILGSKYYVENPLFPLKDIKFLVNCDIMGTGDKGITVVNGTIHKKEFKKLAVINLEKAYLEKVKVRGRAANSDHYWFSQRQVPAIFIYTMGGITAYHDVFDKSETLPLTEFSDLSNLLIDFIKIL